MLDKYKLLLFSNRPMKKFKSKKIMWAKNCKKIWILQKYTHYRLKIIMKRNDSETKKESGEK